MLVIKSPVFQLDAHIKSLLFDCCHHYDILVIEDEKWSDYLPFCMFLHAGDLTWWTINNILFNWYHDTLVDQSKMPLLANKRENILKHLVSKVAA